MRHWQAAEDLAQRTLTDAYVHWRRIQRAGNPDAYVHRMLVNNAHSRWRHRATHEIPRAAIDSGGSGRDHADVIADRDAILTALLALPQRQREVVVLRHLLSLSEAETAEAMGVSTGTVKSSASRALQSLRAYLTEETPARRRRRYGRGHRRPRSGGRDCAARRTRARARGSAAEMRVDPIDVPDTDVRAFVVPEEGMFVDHMTETPRFHAWLPVGPIIATATSP